MKRAYFNWLVENFCADPTEDPRLFDFHHLLEQMHRKDYYYIIRNDENRADDGLYLRYLFNLNDDAPVPEGPCSFLEFLIGVSSQLSELLADGDPLPVYLYFWELVTNLGLDRYNDEAYGFESTVFLVDTIMNNFMDRKCGRCGEGGLFPLTPPCRNQKRVEVWYQLQAYLMEHPNFFETSMV